MFPKHVKLGFTITLLCRKGSINNEIRVHLASRYGRPVYELNVRAQVFGAWNAKFINFGFVLGEQYEDLKIEPVDPTRPIVLATRQDLKRLFHDFYFLDRHDGGSFGMHNYRSYRSRKIIVDCGTVSINQSRYSYWSIVVNGERFVQTQNRKVPGGFGNFWQVDLNRLCAYIGGAYGDRGVHELRAHAARYKRMGGVTPEEELIRCEERRRALAHERGILQYHNRKLEMLVRQLEGDSERKDNQ